MDEQHIVPIGSNPLALDPEIKKNLVTWEDHISYFLALEEYSSRFSWAKADVLASLSEKFGEKSLKELSNEIKIPYTTVTSYTRLSQAFPPDKRIPVLPFTTHIQASKADSYNTATKTFDGEKRFDWAKKAADGQLSVSQLSMQMQEEELRAGLDISEIPCCKCGKIGNLLKYVIYSHGNHKKNTILDIHETCMQEVLLYAQQARYRRAPDS